MATAAGSQRSTSHQGDGSTSQASGPDLPRIYCRHPMTDDGTAHRPARRRAAEASVEWSRLVRCSATPPLPAVPGESIVKRNSVGRSRPKRESSATRRTMLRAFKRKRKRNPPPPQRPPSPVPSPQASRPSPSPLPAPPPRSAKASRTARRERTDARTTPCTYAIRPPDGTRSLAPRRTRRHADVTTLAGCVGV